MNVELNHEERKALVALREYAHKLNQAIFCIETGHTHGHDAEDLKLVEQALRERRSAAGWEPYEPNYMRPKRNRKLVFTPWENSQSFYVKLKAHRDRINYNSKLNAFGWRMFTRRGKRKLEGTNKPWTLKFGNIEHWENSSK